MTITFPRDMLCGVVQADFSISRPMAVNRLNGGVTQVRELGAPRWVGRFTYAGHMRARFQTLQAWLDSLRGGLNSFYAHDALKPFPVTYRGVMPGGWNGLGALTGMSASTINVAIPVALTIKAGDMVGLIEGTKRGLYRIVEDSSGTSNITVTVEPPINPALFTLAATANFVRPVCEMVLEPGSVSTVQTAGAPAAISFAGVQRVR